MSREGPEIGASVVNSYCSCQPGYGLGLGDGGRTTLTEDRIRHLRRKEWQRWFPVIGLGRLFKDLFRGDGVLLDYMWHPAINTLNRVYNPVAAMGTVTLSATVFG